MKKSIKILSYTLLLLILFTCNNVYALDTSDSAFAGFCVDLDLLNMLSYVRTIIDLIKVFGPVVVVIMSTIDVVKAVMASNQEEIQKNMHRIPNRLMLMAILFLLPVLFDFIVTTVNSDNQSFACLNAANKETIQAAYQNIAYVEVDAAENSLDYTDLSVAQNSLTYISDLDLKDNLQSRLDAVKKKIAEIQAEKNKSDTTKDNTDNNTDNNNTNINNGSDYWSNPMLFIANAYGMPTALVESIGKSVLSITDLSGLSASQYQEIRQGVSD